MDYKYILKYFYKMTVVPTIQQSNLRNDISITNMLRTQFQFVYLRESTNITTVTHLTLIVQNYHRPSLTVTLKLNLKLYSEMFSFTSNFGFFIFMQ